MFAVGFAFLASTAGASQCSTTAFEEGGTSVQAFAKTNVSDASACCAACSDNAKCGHWVFNPNTDDNCHLKPGGLTSKVQAQNSFRGSASPSPAPKGAPNLLLLFPDQWRYDWDGLHESLNTGELPLKMPVTRSLAASGVRFTQAYVPAPVCAPSRSCLASGRQYDHTKVPSNSHDFPAVSEVPTFYSLLRSHGYHTMTTGKDDLTKASQLGSNTGYPGCPECKDGDGLYRADELGFSDSLRYSGKMDVVQQSVPHEMYGFFLRNHSVSTEDGNETNAWEAHRACFGKGDQSLCDHLTYKSDFYEDDFTAANAVELLRRRPRDRPFFLHVSFPGPHDPFLVTAEMRATASDGRSWPEATDDPTGNATAPGGACKATGEPDKTEIRCNYAAEVENLDRLFKVVLDEVKAQGEMDNTLVVVTSDHGEMLGDHGDRAKSKPWQGSASVPLIISGPGVTQPGRVVSSPVGNLDIVGTFLDFAGVKPDSSMETMTMRSLLDPSSKAQSYRSHVNSGLDNFRMVVKQIDRISYKYICCKGKCPGAPTTAPPVSKSGWMQMLIDVDNDEFDMHDLSKDKPEIVYSLRSLLPQAGYSGNYSAGCATIDAPDAEQEAMRLKAETLVVHSQMLGSVARSFGVDLRGVEVTAVQDDTPAFSAGVNTGLQLLTVNGMAVRDGQEIEVLEKAASLGSAVAATFGLPELIV